MTREQMRLRIRQGCEQRGWTVLDLARHSQVSPEAIRRFVTGTGEVSTRVVARLAKALGIEMR